MIAYLLDSMLCALFLWGIYCFLLEKEKMLRFKRFFLLGALLFSLLIPLLQIPSSWGAFPSVGYMADTYILTADGAEEVRTLVPVPENAVEPLPVADEPQPKDAAFSWKLLLIGVYLLVTTVLLARFIANLVRIVKLARHAPAERRHGKVKVIIEEKLDASFSFFNYIFIGKNDCLCNDIRKEILIHELVHVKQKHSADILFVELLIVFLWFHPVLYLYRRAVKLNHEFLADEGVVSSTGDVPAYQLLLIDRVATSLQPSLTSNFAYLITKKRLIMMTKTASKKNTFFKLALLLPALLLAGSMFSDKAMADTFHADRAEGQEQGSVAVNDTIIVPESGVSPEVMDEYARIISKYLGEVTDKKVQWTRYDISEEDQKALYAMFIQMTQEQREVQLLRFVSPLCPEKSRRNNIDEWNGCISPKNKEIWLDGKLVDAKTARTYDRESMVYFHHRSDTDKAFMWTETGYGKYIEQYGKHISRADLFSIMPHFWCMTGYSGNGKIVNGRIVRALHTQDADGKG